MKKHLLILFIWLGQFSAFAYQQSNFSAFVYHRFGDDRYPSTNISAEAFEAHLKYLKTNKVQVLTMHEALKQLKADNSILPSTAVITIDDAYKSFYKNGWPLLKKYGFKATLFVNTKTVGAGDFMTWEQIKEVKAAGIEVANHSHAHSYFLNDFKTSEFSSDLIISHRYFERMLGEWPNGYAHPYGEWNEEMTQLLDSLGYQYATAQNSGPIYKDSPMFRLPRFPMSNTYADIDEFKQKLTVNALEVNQLEVIKSGFQGSIRKPRLLISFKEGDYDLKNLQSFIQGSEAKKSIEVLKDGVVRLSLWPETAISKRRTLFTVTVTDRNGKWHWFSYSYVLPGFMP